MHEQLLILAETAQTEDDRVDFKREFSPEKKASFWVEIVKDIVALANSKGGALIFGLNDDGTPSEIDCSELLGFDPAKITDQIHKYTGLQFSGFQITEVVRPSGKFPGIIVLPTRLPIVFTKVGSYEVSLGKQKTAFSVGTLYFRHGAKSEPANQDDIRDAFYRELSCVREDWLGNIRRVVEADPNATIFITNEQQEDATFRLTRDPSAPAVRVKDLSETHPYRQSEVISEVRKRRKDLKRFNGHDIQAVKFAEQLDHKSNADLVHKPHVMASPQYSEAFVEFICEQISANDNYLEDCRVKLRDAKYGTKSA